MTVSLPIGPGWGRVVASAAETFTITGLPAGVFFYGFQPTYALGSTLTIYSNLELTAVRTFPLTKEWAAAVGKLEHSGGDLTFVVTLDPGIPYNRYGLGWAHADLDVDPTHWSAFTPGWTVTKYSTPIGSGSVSGDYSASYRTYGTGMPTSPVGVGPHYPIDPVEEAENYANLPGGGIRSMLDPFSASSPRPYSATSTNGNGFTYERTTKSALRQGTTKFRAIDVTTLPTVYPVTSETVLYNTFLNWPWGKITTGVPEYRDTRLMILALSEKPNEMGFMRFRALLEANRLNAGTLDGDSRTPVDSWSDRKYGWQTGGAIVFGPQYALDTTAPVYDVPDYIAHVFNDYMSYAIPEPAPSTDKFIRFTITASEFDSGVAVVPAGDDDPNVIEVVQVVGASGGGIGEPYLETEYKSPPGVTFLGFPLLPGILKCLIEDPVYDPGVLFWSEVGTGQGYAAMKVPLAALSEAPAVERDARVDRTAALPIYIMAADGWHKTSDYVPGGFRPAPPSNDLLADAFLLNTSGSVSALDNRGATKDDPSTLPNSLWWWFTLTAASVVSFRVTAAVNWDSVLNLYLVAPGGDRTVVADLTLAASDDQGGGGDLSWIQNYSAAAGIYVVEVGGYVGSSVSDDFTLTWSGLE